MKIVSWVQNALRRAQHGHKNVRVPSAGGDVEKAGGDHPNVCGDADCTADGFGTKTIGYFGGVCLLANNITGPGMVQLPQMFQQTGWAFAVIFIVFMAVFSGVTSLYLSKAISLMPGNDQFQHRAEFESLASAYLPKWGHVAAMIVLIFNFQ